MKSPTPPLRQPSIIFNGPVGAVQTGPSATANVQQHWPEGDSTALAEGLLQLRNAIGQAPGLYAKKKDELVAYIDRAGAEVKAEHPSKSKLLEWVSGVAVVVRTVGSAQPAFEMVRTAAKTFGLSL